MVKQSFEIANSKQYYQNEVSILQSEIANAKNDFSQTLNDVKSSFLHQTYQDDDQQSVPDVEFMNTSGDYLCEEEKNNQHSRNMVMAHKSHTQSNDYYFQKGHQTNRSSASK